MSAKILKRIVDLAGASIGLVTGAPLILVFAGLVKLTGGSPIFFRQVRPGLGGRPFTLYKFRTMRNAHDNEGEVLPDDKRLTGLGRFLRSTSLDELPELFNVLKGEMSLVGPRPLLMEYLDLYTPQQARRHEVKPGITGWTQVKGRNALTWEEKFEFDIWYVDHWSLWQDIKILALTPFAVLRREGIRAAGSATMPTFKGTQKETHG